MTLEEVELGLIEEQIEQIKAIKITQNPISVWLCHYIERHLPYLYTQRGLLCCED